MVVHTQHLHRSEYGSHLSARQGVTKACLDYAGVVINEEAGLEGRTWRWRAYQ